MRVANVAGRLALLHDNRALDVEKISSGRFSGDIHSMLGRWEELAEWASAVGYDDAEPFEPEDLQAPISQPAQIFAIGLNYRDHAAESNLAIPSAPVVFTKFSSCLTGANSTVTLPSSNVDWEVELVAVIGRRAEHVRAENALGYLAGVTVGQDLSERVIQLQGPAPQFALGKSFLGFGPMGPAVVTLDELGDPDDLDIGCSVGAEVLQRGRTSDMIFPLPELVARLSAVCPLLPGDLIWSGTPSGVGNARDPRRFLQPDTTLVSWIDGVGELRNPLRSAIPGIR